MKNFFIVIFFITYPLQPNNDYLISTLAKTAICIPVGYIGSRVIYNLMQSYLRKKVEQAHLEQIRFNAQQGYELQRQIQPYLNNIATLNCIIAQIENEELLD